RASRTRRPGMDPRLQRLTRLLLPNPFERRKRSFDQRLTRPCRHLGAPRGSGLVPPRVISPRRGHVAGPVVRQADDPRPAKRARCLDIEPELAEKLGAVADDPQIADSNGLNLTRNDRSLGTLLFQQLAFARIDLVHD